RGNGVRVMRAYAHGELGRLLPSTPFRQLTELLLGETQRSTLHRGAPNISTTVTSTMMLKHNPMARSIRNRVSGPGLIPANRVCVSRWLWAVLNAFASPIPCLPAHVAACPSTPPLVVKAADRSQRKKLIAIAPTGGVVEFGEESSLVAHPSVSDCSRTYGRSSDIFVASVALRCLPATAVFAIYSARLIRHPNCRECRFPDSPL